MGHSKWISGILSLVILTVFTASCSNDDEESTDPVNNDDDRVETYSNFEGRITYHNDSIDAYEEGSGKAGKKSNFAHVADISAPTINGKTLSASGIAFQGNKAYVSYHWNNQPNDYSGAIEVINISKPDQPTLTSGIYFSDTDLNELYVQGNEIYSVGRRELSSSGYDPSLTDGGIVNVVYLQAGQVTNQLDETWVPGYSANSVFRHSNQLYVASGNTGGGVFEIDLQNNNFLQPLQSDFYDHSKFGVKEGNNMIFLQGGPNAKLHVHASHNFDPNAKTEIPLSSPTAPSNAKNVLYVDHPENLAYVSSGEHGLNVYDVGAMSGTAVQSFNTSGPGLLNGVHVAKDYVFAAKGSEGLYILEENDITNIKAQFQFSGSANYVRATNNNVFIAHGTGGLKVLAR